MSDRDKAIELVENYMLWKFQKCAISKVNAIQCAKIDLNNRIELLNRMYNNTNESNNIDNVFKHELQSLENQLTHLNNL